MGSSVYDLNDNTTLYEVLGVPRTATEKDIRRAYLKLVVLYHPDKNPDGAEIFKEICFAHGVLSDPQQRAMYDSKSLRQNLQGRAKEYDPAMDPRVQLSAEDLRKFVEKLESAQTAKRKEKSDFDRLMEEEMQRRAEYDAKNPFFKAQYERERKRRQSLAAGAAASQSTSQSPLATAPASSSPAASAYTASSAPRTVRTQTTSAPGACAGLCGYRTSAELTEKLEADERNRLYGLPPTTDVATSSSFTGGGSGAGCSSSPSSLSVRQQMMSKYRAEQATVASGGSAHSSHGSATSGHMSTTKLDFVKAQREKVSYTERVEDAIRTYSQFDYLDYVTNDRRDQAPIASAVTADALGLYVRNVEDPRALD